MSPPSELLSVLPVKAFDRPTAPEETQEIRTGNVSSPATVSCLLRCAPEEPPSAERSLLQPRASLSSSDGNRTLPRARSLSVTAVPRELVGRDAGDESHPTRDFQ
ncbi:hypothetical protein AAFF_G00221190 [Aldrovandia affinis]|uniref:Uncharacterized protein n=1 Tax=Aldrovandia affinis TaxID=143900 RepID=A0AAD7RFV7_9TELE|nr:hypothetical protein AAFF_G00221190 [Aldrovandia affinis]